MTSLEATDLAVRILQAFNGPPASEWEDVLADLDAGRAGTTYARLRREHDNRWLSIARFMETYRSLNTDDASTRGPTCQACDGTGWLTGHRYVEKGVMYSGVKPCTCSEGRQRSGSSAWLHSKPRDLLTDREADRLLEALKESA